VRLDIDRARARAMGVPFSAITDMVGTSLGSSHVNDFPNEGRLQQVIVQANAAHRMRLEDVLALRVRNTGGGTVALAELVTPVWEHGLPQLTNYNGYPSISITGSPAAGTERRGDEGHGADRGGPAAGLCHRMDRGFASGAEAGAQAPLLLETLDAGGLSGAGCPL
jgi:multidrug efflux pump